jgi:hypothetical protein
MSPCGSKRDYDPRVFSHTLDPLRTVRVAAYGKATRALLDGYHLNPHKLQVIVLPRLTGERP